MASQDRTTSTETETELVAQLLGTDPWLRFDMWAARAWEATESAVNIARGGDMSEDGMDGRILALFHAAQIAKDFSEMVNPLFAATSGPSAAALSAASKARIMSLALDDDDE